MPTQRKRKLAIYASSTGDASPADECESATSSTSPKREPQTRARSPKLARSGLSPIETSPADEQESASSVSAPTSRKPTPASIIPLLIDWQIRRSMAIAAQIAANNKVDMFLAQRLGMRIDIPEKRRKEIYASAQTFRCAVEKGEEGQSELVSQRYDALLSFVPLILSNAVGRKGWDTIRDEAEGEIEGLAKKLPVWDFVKSVKGFGPLGLGVWAAEARIPLGEYRTVSGLWRRMGLAVIDGRRQRFIEGDADNNSKYSPRRRAEVYAFTEPMFRHQWAAPKEGAPAHAKGPYGEVYGRRRATTLSRVEETAELPAGNPEKWTLKRCHHDGMRVMAKALLRDLWRVWRGMPPREFCMDPLPLDNSPLPRLGTIPNYALGVELALS